MRREKAERKENGLEKLENVTSIETCLFCSEREKKINLL
jgi:hypothetical protein